MENGRVARGLVINECDVSLLVIWNLTSILMVRSRQYSTVELRVALLQ